MTLVEDGLRSPSIIEWDEAKEFLNESQSICDFADLGLYSELSHQAHMTRAHEMLSHLIDSCINTKASATLAERASTFVNQAYAVRHIQTVQLYLNICLGRSSMSKAKKIWLNICFLGRLKSAVRTFEECARRLPNFSNIKFHFVTPPQTERTPPLRRLSLVQAMDHVDLTHNLDTIRTYLNSKKGLSQIAKDFDDLQARTMRVHAEVQIITHLLSAGYDLQDVFPYIGCSKLSCFLCGRFIESLGYFETRGCHEKIYISWTVAECNLNERAATRLIKALRKVHDVMKQIIQTAMGARNNRVAESSAGITKQTNLDYDSNQLSGNWNELSAVRTANHDRGQIRGLASHLEELASINNPGEAGEAWHAWSTSGLAFLPRNKIDEGSGHSGTEDRGIEHHIPDVKKECSHCRKPTTKKCSGCRSASYCSGECQRAEWYRHIFKCCPGRELDSADFLVLAVYDGGDHPDLKAAEDFGFNKLVSLEAINKLSHIYFTLVRKLHVGSRALHKWQTKNSLYSEIVRRLLLTQSHGPNFQWLLQNRHILDCNVSHVQPITDEEYSRARHYIGETQLGDDERVSKTAQTFQQSRRDAIDFYALTLGQKCPLPHFRERKEFKVCDIIREVDELGLRDLFQDLLTKCTFYEFRNAIAHDTILHLLDQYGFHQRRSRYWPNTFTTALTNEVVNNGLFDLREYGRTIQNFDIEAGMNRFDESMEVQIGAMFGSSSPLIKMWRLANRTSGARQEMNETAVEEVELKGIANDKCSGHEENVRDKCRSES